MDSGNSGSMQSSSGGDEEYDSRAESISALLSNPSSHLGPMGANQPPPHHQHHQHHQHQTQLDPLSNLFDPSSSRLSNPNSLLNFDMVWSKTLRSDPNSTDLAGLISSSSSAHNQISQPFLTANNNINSNNNIQLGSAQQPRFGGGSGVGGVGSSTFASLPIPQEQNVSASSSAPSNQTHNNNGVVRNPKKRSRASRRAPTTVLTTDTTNFRAMVQEFTGIPAPPFTSSSHFPRGRLDLFGSAAAASSFMRSAGIGGGGGGGGGLGLEPSPPPYLLRPFAHKISTSPFDPSINPTTSTTNHNNLLNIQNPSPSPSSSSVLNFQSLFQQQQQQPKYPLPINSPTSLAPNSNSKPPHHHHQSSLGPPHNSLLDQDHHFGFPLHPHVNADNASQLNINPNWGDGNDKSSSNNNNNVDRHQGLMRSINGSNFANGKLTFSAAGSSSNINVHHHGDRGPPQQDQNVTTTTTTTTTRSEGMVESWICSSD